MTIEDRVRQLMAAAVADEPPPRGAPLERPLRRPRRPALAGAVALVLAAVVGLVALRSRGGTRPVAPAPTTTPPPTTAVSTAGWKTYTDAAHNLRLRYPPDRVAHTERRGHRHPGPAGARPEGAGQLAAVRRDGGRRRVLLPGRGSRAGVRPGPAALVQWPGGPPVPANVADRRRSATWSID